MNVLHADRRKNRLYISLLSDDSESARQTLQEIEAVCPEFKLNFTCIADIGRCTPLSRGMEEILLTIQQRATELGVGKVVWVLGPDPAKALEGLPPHTLLLDDASEFSRTTGEAEEILDQYVADIRGKRCRRKRERYKIIDMSGWEDDCLFDGFPGARKRLAALRKSGKTDAIIVSTRSADENSLEG